MAVFSPEQPGDKPYSLLYLLFQINASPEFDDFGGRDDDGGAGAGVMALAFLALFHNEGTEARQREPAFGDKSFLDGGEQGVQRLFGAAFTDGAYPASEESIVSLKNIIDKALEA